MTSAPAGPSEPRLVTLTEHYADLKRLTLDDARPAAAASQHDRGKLTARERVDLLVDPGTFVELGQLGRAKGDTELMQGVDAPADGIVVGRARIDDRPVVVVSYDFTVLGASMGRVNDEKFARARHISLRSGVPLIMLIEGGGARINERMGSTTIRGHERFSDLGLMSGWTPIICGVVGPTYAGHANLVALSDFVVMVKGASLGLAGPRLIEAVTGEQVSTEDFGSSFHARRIGSVEAEVETEQHMVDRIRSYLALLPSNSQHKPPRALYSPCGDERLDDAVYRLVPDNPNRAYDMHTLVRMVLDDDGSSLEIKPTFARNVITTLGRIGGHTVGLIANNPMVLAGVLDSNASDKMARFINVCDAFSIPLVVLVDVPGYIVGLAAERTNLVRRSMRPLWELSQADVPILTVVVRKAYGLAYHTMGGAEFHPDLMVCWPSAQVSPMGAEGAANVLIPSAASEDRARMVETFKALERPLVAAEEFKIDDVIDPRDTRRVLLEALNFGADSQHSSGHWRPPKKRGIAPA